MCSRVMVVVDARVMRRFIIRAVEEIGLTQVVVANDGEEALVEFAKQPFMLILTDWNMPRKNGLELIQGVRATGSKVPIIMITTESEKARVFSAIEAGVTDYLVKPFDAATLRTKVEKHVGSLAT